MLHHRVLALSIAVIKVLPMNASPFPLSQQQHQRRSICCVFNRGVRGALWWRPSLESTVTVGPADAEGDLFGPLPTHRHTLQEFACLTSSYQFDVPNADSLCFIWDGGYQRYFTMQIPLCPFMWNLANMPCRVMLSSGAALDAALSKPWSGSMALLLLTCS